MFWNKREEPKECPDPFKGKRKCEECKHYVDEYEMTTVLVCNEPRMSYSYSYWDNGESTLYYCPMHKKPYDKEITYGEKKGFYKDIPQHYEKVEITN